MRELSWTAILLGVVIGAALAAANAFVGLKVGMTISASIPAAVMSLLILRVLLKRGTLLESNMVQTVGSAGESLTAGMIFTIPALFIMGQKPAYLEMVIWGAIGGLLGVCFMVPLRRVLIVREHGVLPYPEGVACAEVLQSGERGGSGAVSVIWGAIVGAGFQLFTGLGVWPDKAVTPVPEQVKTQGSLAAEPALLGVGYILGVRIAAMMLAGGVLAWFVLIPGIGYFGANAEQLIAPSKEKTISAMSPGDIHDAYIRYIGAGAVAIGGLISLFKSFPTIASSIWHVATGFLKTGKRSGARTDKDLPFLLLLLILAGLGYVMWVRPEVKVGHWGAIAVLVFGFFFVTVSSRLVGLVGSSSNPASGMTIAALLGTALVFKFVFLKEGTEASDATLTSLRVACLSVGAIVCIAICIAGDCSQDLKTGFLLKATPWKQQVGEMIGVLTAVLAIAGVIMLLGQTHGFSKTDAHPNPLSAPQANIMKILVEGVLGGELPWVLIIMGGFIAIIVELLGLPALPFAVGLYLPLSLTTPIMVGGGVRWIVDLRKRSTEHDPGVLTASGLVAGMGLMGVFLAGVTALISWGWNDPRWHDPLDKPDGPYVVVYDQPEAVEDEPVTPPPDEPSEAEPEPQRAQWKSAPVTPHHLMPWIWERWAPGLMRWGLSRNWWNGIAIIPFALMTLWLWWMAMRRPKISLPPPTGAMGAGPSVLGGPTTPATQDASEPADELLSPEPGPPASTIPLAEPPEPPAHEPEAELDPFSPQDLERHDDDEDRDPFDPWKPPDEQ